MTKEEAREELKEIQQLLHLHNSGIIHIGARLLKRLGFMENKLISYLNNI